MITIEQTKAENTSEAWRQTYYSTEERSLEELLCREKSIECAKAENTAIAWLHAYHK